MPERSYGLDHHSSIPGNGRTSDSDEDFGCLRRKTIQVTSCQDETCATPKSREGPCMSYPRCRLCSSELRHTFVDLGMSPPCESYVTAPQLDAGEKFYPLHVR